MARRYDCAIYNIGYHLMVGLKLRISQKLAHTAVNTKYRDCAVAVFDRLINFSPHKAANYLLCHSSGVVFRSKV